MKMDAMQLDWEIPIVIEVLKELNVYRSTLLSGLTILQRQHAELMAVHISFFEFHRFDAWLELKDFIFMVFQITPHMLHLEL